MITVLSWLWEQPGGRATFTSEHVAIWADMVRRNLSMPHRLACVTHMPLPAGVERIVPPGDFENVFPPWGPRKPNCYRRLAMFRPDAAKLFGKRFVCMDLDCIISGPLDPLFDRPEDLVIAKGTHRSRPYNGSLMLIKAGCRPQVYQQFDQQGADLSGAEFHGSDQAWLAYSLGWGEATWGAADGIEFWTRRWSPKQSKPRLLFFPGRMKPWDLASINVFPWVTNNYRVAEKEAA